MHRDDKRPEPDADHRIPVLNWLLEVGHAVVRKFKGVPASPLVRIND